MKISVIISTYNNPQALRKTLWGYYDQSYANYEILIADDGSGDETGEVIDAARSQLSVPLRHIWHEDVGFRKSRILNQAITQSRGEYVIFTDGDCIPRRDFVASHARKARPNWFISGGSHIDVPASIHQNLVVDDVHSQRVFNARWLQERGMNLRRYRRRLCLSRHMASVMDFLMPRAGVFLGANASAWIRDLVAVNGFESSSSYGSDDKELGVRLGNNGIRSKRLKYSLICVHQSHVRPYSTEQIKRNKENLKTLKANRTTWIEDGIHTERPAA